MKNKNICKFPSSGVLGRSISVYSFVKETDVEVMKHPSRHKCVRMLLATAGEGTVCIDDRRVSLKAGALLFLFPFELSFIEEETALEYLYIDFDGARADELMRRFDITPFSRIRYGYDGLIPLWEESLFRATDDSLELAAESMILYSFSRLSRDSSVESGLMGHIFALTEENFSDPELGIESIARELAYNPKYISHVFKKQAKINYSEYLRSVRIKYATVLFDNGIDSVKNVAHLSGFSDPFYFSSVFKRVIGLSPTEYIRTKRPLDMGTEESCDTPLVDGVTK